MLAFWIFIGLAISGVLLTSIVAVRGDASRAILLILLPPGILAGLFGFVTVAMLSDAAHTFAVFVVATVIVVPALYFRRWVGATNQAILDAFSLPLTGLAILLVSLGILYLFIAFNYYGGVAAAALGLVMLTTGSVMSGFGLLCSRVTASMRPLRIGAAVANGSVWALCGLAWVLVGTLPIGVTLVGAAPVLVWIAFRQSTQLRPQVGPGKHGGWHS